MSSADRFFALLAVVLTCASVLMGGMLYMGRMLWSIRGQWDRTNGELAMLVDKINGMVNADMRLESRLDRHEDWHRDHPHRGRR